jgi:hypothetical protein
MVVIKAGGQEGAKRGEGHQRRRKRTMRRVAPPKEEQKGRISSPPEELCPCGRQLDIS